MNISKIQCGTCLRREFHAACIHAALSATVHWFFWPSNNPAAKLGLAPSTYLSPLACSPFLSVVECTESRIARAAARRRRHSTLDRGTYVFFSYAAAVAAVAPEHERFVGVVRFTAAVVLKWLFAKTTKIRRTWMINLIQFSIRDKSPKSHDSIE